MKKLTTSVLVVVLTSSFAMVSAQDTLRTQDIREVVVTGALGIKKRVDELTTANKVIGTGELNQAANPNAAQALTGKVAGLQINTTNNSVDPTNRIVLRGPRSITGSNTALIVIDNVISTDAVFNSLPPEVIENINVIKGAAGAALYGQQGGNGVIVVTTKRGTRSTKVQFNLTSSIDVSSVYKLPIIQRQYGQGIQDDTFSDVDYGGTNWVPYENTSWGPAFNSSLGGQVIPVGMPQDNNGNFINSPYKFNKDNWGDFFQNGILLQNGLSMNVGGSDSYVFLSLNRTENDFMVQGDNLKRNSFLFKAGKTLGNLSISGNINLIDQRTTQTDGNLYDDLIQTPSNVEVKRFRNSGNEAFWTAYGQNPYWTIENVRFNNQVTRFNGTIGLDYKINNNISLTYNGTLLTTSTSADDHNNGYTYSRIYDGTGTLIDGTSLGQNFGQANIISGYNKTTSRFRRYYGDIMINFNYDLTPDLKMKLNIGNNMQDEFTSQTSLGGTNLKIPGYYNINNVLNPSAITTLNNTTVRYRSVAAFANLDLGFKDYLFLNGTYRLEGTSTLSDFTNPGSNKPYSYYSGGVSFIATKAFPSIKGDILSYLKVSGSGTRVGNASNISPYAINPIGIFATGYPFGQLSPFLLNQSPTSLDTTPEFITTLEGNLNFGLFKDRLTVDFSAYRTNTDGLINFSNTSYTTGFTRIQDNVGSLRNKGFDVDVNIIPIKSSDFEWRVGANYSTYKTEVTDLGEGVNEVNLLSYANPAVGIFATKGEQFPVIKGTKYQRDPSGNIIVGANGVPLTTSGFEVLGKVNPDYILGMTTSIRYKGFTLSGVADYRTGNSFVAITKRLLGFTGGLEKSADFDRTQGYIVPNSVQNTGTAANPVYTANTTPVLGLSNYTGVTNYFTSAYLTTGEEFVVDGSALKIREIALSYKVPSSVLENSFVNSLTLGVYARNAFIFYSKENRNYADPETASTNGNAAGVALTGQYPNTRNFGFNINVTF